MEARSCKSAHCQLILLDILPRLASFVDIHNGRPFQQVKIEPNFWLKLEFFKNILWKEQVQEVADHLISVNAKYPQALLSLGLLSLNRPQAMRARVSQILQIIVQNMKMAVGKYKNP